jgi:hypothetical protein
MFAVCRDGLKLLKDRYNQIRAMSKGNFKNWAVHFDNFDCGPGIEKFAPLPAFT